MLPAWLKTDSYLDPPLSQWVCTVTVVSSENPFCYQLFLTYRLILEKSFSFYFKFLVTPCFWQKIKMNMLWLKLDNWYLNSEVRQRLNLKIPDKIFKRLLVWTITCNLNLHKLPFFLPLDRDMETVKYIIFIKQQCSQWAERRHTGMILKNSNFHVTIMVLPFLLWDRCGCVYTTKQVHCYFCFNNQIQQIAMHVGAKQTLEERLHFLERGPSGLMEESV